MSHVPVLEQTSNSACPGWIGMHLLSSRNHRQHSFPSSVALSSGIHRKSVGQKNAWQLQQGSRKLLCSGAGVPGRGVGGAMGVLGKSHSQHDQRGKTELLPDRAAQENFAGGS